MRVFLYPITPPEGNRYAVTIPFCSGSGAIFHASTPPPLSGSIFIHRDDEMPAPPWDEQSLAWTENGVRVLCIFM
jgi:hypothetical protein